MRVSRTALRTCSAVLCGSLLLAPLTACSSSDDDNANSSSYATAGNRWNNVFYHNGEYYCVYPSGAREACGQAVDPNGDSIPSDNWIEAQDPGNYSPDSSNLTAIAWGVYLLNLDWFDDLFDHLFKGKKYKNRRASLHSQLKRNRSTYRGDIGKIKSNHWTPPTKPAAKAPDKGKGTKDCAMGLDINDDSIDLAAFDSKSSGGSGGNKSSNKGTGKTKTDTDTDTGSASGGSSGASGGGLDLNKDQKDSNKQQPRQRRGNDC